MLAFSLSALEMVTHDIIPQVGFTLTRVCLCSMKNYRRVAQQGSHCALFEC